MSTINDYINISFDESGNTGQDLLNEDQNYFVLSSVHFKDKEKKVLKKIVKQTGEIHFRKLKNSTKGRKQIIEILNHDIISEENIISCVGRKEYIVICQIIEQIMEPYFYEKGIDISKYGERIIHANSMFLFSQCVWDKQLYKKFLHSFIAMFRSKDADSIENFYRCTIDLHDSCDEEYTILYPILFGKKYIKTAIKYATKYTLDVTLSAFLLLCDSWYKKLFKKIDVYFDNSKQIEYYTDYIKFLRDMNSDKVEVGFGSRKMIFPTQIRNLELVDSSKNLSIQFADLIASSIAFTCNNKNKKHLPFVEEIEKSKLFQLKNYHSIIGENKFTPEELDMTSGNGINMLDFIASKR